MAKIHTGRRRKMQIYLKSIEMTSNMLYNMTADKSIEMTSNMLYNMTADKSIEMTSNMLYNMTADILPTHFKILSGPDTACLKQNVMLDEPDLISKYDCYSAKAVAESWTRYALP